VIETCVAPRESSSYWYPSYSAALVRPAGCSSCARSCASTAELRSAGAS